MCTQYILENDRIADVCVTQSRTQTCTFWPTNILVKEPINDAVISAGVTRHSCDQSRSCMGLWVFSELVDITVF